MSQIGLRAVDAFSEACRSGPRLGRDVPTRKGISLYGWNTGPVKEVHIPESNELIMSLHLAGSRRVRVFTGDGLSRSVSKPGDITLMPHGQPISFRTDGAVDFATIHFPSNIKPCDDADAWNRLLALSSCLFAFRDEYVSASVKALMQAAQTPSRDNAAYFSSVLDALVAHLARRVDEGDNEQIALPSNVERGIRPPDFDAVLRHIEDHLSEKVSLEVLSECAGVSRAVFAREFTARFGCAPHRYLNLRRVERAKLLLTESSLRLSDIAYEVGFSGQSHFSSTFKAFVGCSPQAFAKGMLGNA